MLFKNKIEYTKGMFVEIYGTEIKKARLVLRIITGIAVVAAIAFMIYGAAARGFIMPGDFFNLGIAFLMALLCTILPNLMALSQMKKQLAEAGFAKENMDSALQKKTQFENDNDMDKLLAPNECPYTLDELNEMISKVEGSLDEIRASLVQYGRQMDDLQEQLDMRDEKEQEYRNCKQIQAEEKHKYEILGLTSDYLTRAREQFTARYMAPISNGFQKYFGILTENTDRDWQVDANISIRMKEQGQLRDVRTMSAGYKDLIGICMRFALVDAMYPGEKPFLILDDPFVNLDDEKLARGRRLLAVLSQDYQVIYFTCHGSRE